MASRSYTKGVFKIADSTINWSSDTIVVLLVNSAYAHDPTHNFISDIVANEISVVGYSRQTLAGKTITEDDTNDRAVYDGNDVTFSTLTAGQTIGGAIVARNTGADATSELIFFNDTADTATNGGDILITWNADGIGYFQI